MVAEQTGNDCVEGGPTDSQKVSRPENASPIKRTTTDPDSHSDSWYKPNSAENESQANEKVAAETGASVAYTNVEYDTTDDPNVWKYYFLVGGHISALSEDLSENFYQSEEIAHPEGIQEIRFKMLDSEGVTTDNPVNKTTYSMIKAGSNWGDVIREEYSEINDCSEYEPDPDVSEFNDLMDNWDTYHALKNIDTIDEYQHVDESVLSEFTTVGGAAMSFYGAVVSGGISGAIEVGLGTYALIDMWRNGEVFAGGTNTEDRPWCWRGEVGYGSGIGHGQVKAGFKVRVPVNKERKVQVHTNFPAREEKPTRQYNPNAQLTTEHNFEIDFASNPESAEPGGSDFEEPEINIINSCSKEVTNDDCDKGDCFTDR